MNSKDIERLFNQDIREKRRTGSGAFHKRGKGVKHHISGVKTTYDYMTTRERKLLNGKVVVTNMYETILTRAEFERKDEETQKLLLTKWRELYPNKMILKQMGISSNTLVMFMNKLGIEKKRKGGFQPRRNQGVNEVEETTEEPSTLGLALSYSGEYKSEQINKMLTKLQLLLDEEDSSFDVQITIKEK